MNLSNLIKKITLLSLVTIFLFTAVEDSFSQRRRNSEAQTTTYDEALYSTLDYRNIGPWRGGRSAAVTGISGSPLTYYMGTTGGGVWKTADGGGSWQNISDGFFGGSIGAVEVNDWDPNVIYVGGGEKTVRGNVSHGSGMWKSTDAGKTWASIGLKNSQRIPRVRSHPKNPDLVYAAVLGHLFGPSEDRGIYRSKDGGESWEKILYVNDQAGAVDLIMDPTNPRILYASTWRVIRRPYALESGGEGSGLWKSTDGGDTWIEITKNDGLPQGIIGISGITVSPVNPERVWALIEAEDGGLFRSEDGGETFKKINTERSLRQRAWYYTRLYADPQDVDGVYVMNVRFWHSKDGGNSFKSYQTPHGDHHDLWIDPNNNQRMIVGDDGGGQVSTDGGHNWTTYENQPTAQFYRVITDNSFPYRIYAAQQDNSTIRIKHRSSGSAITEDDWESTAGGESGHIAIDPRDNDIVYGGSYGGFLMRANHRTEEYRNVNVWPDNPMGHGAIDYKYRFQWNFPIFISSHNPEILYSASQHLHRSTNEGQSWEVISPDLSRNDSTTLGSSGGLITQDNTSVEYYATIFAAIESPHEARVLWAGTDDGLLHVTQNSGESWENITPTGLPEWAQINSIEPHPTEVGGLYVAATRYKSDDFTPYLYRTLDYGKSWKRIDNGIDRQHFTRVIRADPNRAGLLYAGTENGLYISFDDGASWKSFQQNLPIVPITDMRVKENDLVVATQGRSLWIMDDLTVLHQLSRDIAGADVHLFNPRPAYRTSGFGGFKAPDHAGENPANGVVMRFYLKDAPADSIPVSIAIMEEDGTHIRTYSNKAKERSNKLKFEAGLNDFVWNMRYPDAEGFDGLIMWAGSLRGPKAVPGNYQAKLTVGHASGEVAQTVTFTIKADPRVSATLADMEASFVFLTEVGNKVTEVHKAIKQIRAVRQQLGQIDQRVEGQDNAEELLTRAKDIKDQLTAIEEALYQTKNQSRQDPLNFPIRLNNKLAALTGVASFGDYRPTDQTIVVRDELVLIIDKHLAAYRQLMYVELPALNQDLMNQRIPFVTVESAEDPEAGTGDLD